MLHQVLSISRCTATNVLKQTRIGNGIYRLELFHRKFSTSENVSSLDRLFEKGLRQIDDSATLLRGITTLRRVAREDHFPAQCILGRVLLSESRKESQNVANPELFSQELVPSYDRNGLPTGGSKDAGETKLEILRIRHKRKSGDEDLPKEEEGIRWLSKSAEGGHLDAKVALANAWFEDDRHKESMKKQLHFSDTVALEMLEDAANECHPDALYNLGTLYYDGDKIPQDGRKALFYFEKAGLLAKDPSALYWLGQYYMHGDPRIDPTFNGDLEKGWEMILRAVQLGHPLAQLFASLYKAEQGENEEAKKYIDMAIDQENGDALFLCGDLHMQDKGSFYGNESVDYVKALRFYERAGIQGHADALCSAGALHYNGLGTPANKFEAYRCYEQAARLGSLTAYKNIASMHFYGEGPLEKNVEAAKEIFEAVAAVEKGSSST